MAPASCSPTVLTLLTLLLIGTALPYAGAQCTFSFNDCMELYQLEINDNNIYIVGEDETFNRVYCYNEKTTTEGGGWTGVLRQNQTGIETDWDETSDPTGSGSLYGNFWIGTTALAQMTDVDMTLVVRANDTAGKWKVGLFQNFKIEGDKLSSAMTYVDGNIGLDKSVYAALTMSGNCLGYWWHPGCQPITEAADTTNGQTTAALASVEMSIRPTANDTQRACPPLFPFPADAADLTVEYSQHWRDDGGTVAVTCADETHKLVWSQALADRLRSGEDADSVPASQTFTCKLSNEAYAWSPGDGMLPEGPRCVPPCDPGYRSNLETGENHTCLKFVQSTEAVNLRKAWEVCRAEDASPANPFHVNGTLETFKVAAAGHSVYTGVDRRPQTIISIGTVDETLIPTTVDASLKECIFFTGEQFVSKPCFSKEPIEATGVVCQKPKACPDKFSSDPEWGCFVNIVALGEDAMTPLKANRDCATQYGASLPPQTSGGNMTTTYVSTVNRRGDGTTWRDADGTEVTLQLANAGDDSQQCLVVNPAAPDSSAVVACDAALETTATGPYIHCVYPRLTDCYSDAPAPPGTPTEDRALDAVVQASCPPGLVFNETKESSGSLTCNGALGNWLPAELGDCVTRCDSPPDAPPNSVRSPEEASNQTTYTYTCADGLQTAEGAPSSTITCQESGVYQPTGPAECSQCTGFPELDETLVLEPEVTSGAQGDSVVVLCVDNMVTTAGQSNQTVTCGPNGWSPAKLSPCNVCANVPSVDNTTVMVELPSTQSLGSVILYSCPAGKAFDFGSNLTSAICMPEGWTTCHEQLDCSLCVDEPPAAMANMKRIWSNTNQTANYSCTDPLTVDGDNGTQTLGCQTEGWTQELQPCDKCPVPSAGITGFEVAWDGLRLDNSTLTFTCPAGKVHQNLTAEQLFPCTAAGWQSDSPLPCDRCAAPEARPESNAVPTSTAAGVQEEKTLVFNCTTGLATAEGQTTFTETCLATGWSVTGNCTHCAGEPPAQNRSTFRDWTDDKTLGTVATYNCTTGDQLVVTCGAAGWSGTTDPCNELPMHCSDPPEDQFNGTTPEDTGKGTEPSRTATYRCSNGVTSVLRCLEDGTWSTDQTPCAATFNRCPSPPAVPANATVDDSGQFSFGQRNATYTCADGTRTVLYCQNATWTAGVELCKPGSPSDPPPPPPGVFVTDSGPVIDENGTVTQTLTYDCGTGVTTLTWKDGVWTPENAVPCADPKNACPARNASETDVSFVDTGPFSDGVRSASYNCSGAGLADTFTCVNGSWDPADLGPCDGTAPPGQSSVCSYEDNNELRPSRRFSRLRNIAEFLSEI